MWYKSLLLSLTHPCTQLYITAAGQMTCTIPSEAAHCVFHCLPSDFALLAFPCLVSIYMYEIDNVQLLITVTCIQDQPEDYPKPVTKGSLYGAYLPPLLNVHKTRGRLTLLATSATNIVLDPCFQQCKHLYSCA